MSIEHRVSFACHTYCDTGHPFVGSSSRTHDTHTCYRGFESRAVTCLFYDLGSLGSNRTQISCIRDKLLRLGSVSISCMRGEQSTNWAAATGLGLGLGLTLTLTVSWFPTKISDIRARTSVAPSLLKFSLGWLSLKSLTFSLEYVLVCTPHPPLWSVTQQWAKHHTDTKRKTFIQILYIKDFYWQKDRRSVWKILTECHIATSSVTEKH